MPCMLVEDRKVDGVGGERLPVMSGDVWMNTLEQGED